MTIDELRAIQDPAVRAKAVQAVVDEANALAREAAEVRRGAIAEMLEADGRVLWNQPAVIAKACGVSVSTVKSVRYSITASA